LSRAQWLAYGSALTALGCSSGGAAAVSLGQDAAALGAEASAGVDGNPPGGDANSEDGAQGDATAADVAADGPSPNGASQDGGLADANGFAPAQGGFTCTGSFGVPDSVCDRATQWCFINGGGYGTTGCRSLDDTCVPTYLVGDAAPTCMYTIEWDAAACDGGVRRCACLTSNCWQPQCIDDDAGGVSLSCGECYGAPPARLERRRRARPSARAA
jgi:hypothetical protein